MKKVFNTGCFDSRHMDIGYGEGISQEEDWGILTEEDWGV